MTSQNVLQKKKEKEWNTSDIDTVSADFLTQPVLLNIKDLEMVFEAELAEKCVLGRTGAFSLRVAADGWLAVDFCRLHGGDSQDGRMSLDRVVSYST